MDINFDYTYSDHKRDIDYYERKHMDLRKICHSLF